VLALRGRVVACLSPACLDTTLEPA